MISFKCVVTLFVCSLIIYALVNLTIFKQFNKKLTRSVTLSTDVTSGSLVLNEESHISNCQVHRETPVFKESEAKTLYNCSVLDFLAAVDPTVKRYGSDLICDELCEKYNNICRMYLRQNGLDCLESKICLLEDQRKVPKIVYYVIFGVYDFLFSHYVSFMAAKRFIKPTAMYVIGDQHPTGKWWQEVLKYIPGVRFVYRENPGNISGLPPSAPQHLSDVVRLQVLYMNGGIYLDADMVVLKDLEPLLDNDLTMGHLARNLTMANAFIATKRRNNFIREWYAEYIKYKHDKKDYYWNSMMVPMKMWKQNTSRVNMMSDKLYRPTFFEQELLYNRSDFQWRNNYAVHIWKRRKLAPTSYEEIQTANTTIAQIFRYVLYGDERIRDILTYK